MGVEERGVPLRPRRMTSSAEVAAERARRLAGPRGWRPGPLELTPGSAYPPYPPGRDRWSCDGLDDRVAALAHALDGIELGAQDARVLAWLAGWDNGTVATVCSLLRRARVVPVSARAPHALR